jgi:hypothetical protein
MKIAIITHPLAYNIGGLLQNFALQQVLTKLGHQPITFDQTTGYVSRWKLICHNILLMMKRNVEPTSLNNDIDNFISNHINSTSKARFISDFKCLDKRYKPQAYIVGSDQVWRGGYVVFPEANFLSFTNCKCKLAYAASFGVDQWTFNNEITPKLIECAQQFKAISVREESGISICKEIFGKNVIQVLDPTMLLNKEHYIRLTASQPRTNNALATYILDMNETKKAIISSILSQLKLEELSLKHSVTKTLSANISVEQWLAAFRDAEMVVCDSFHGTVFSIIFEKPFIVLANKERGNTRLESLLEIFGLKDRFISNKDINLTTIRPIDWHYVRSQKQELVDKSLNFLISNLNGE